MHTPDWHPHSADTYGQAMSNLPRAIEAGAAITLQLTYVTPAKGLPAGSRIRINLPPGFHPPQTHSQDKAGFLEISACVPVQIELKTFLSFHLVLTESMPGCSRLEVVYNPQGNKSRPVATRVAYHDPVPFSVDVKCPDDTLFTRILTQDIQILARPAARLFLKIPSVVHVGEAFDLVVNVRDDLDNLVTHFSGEILLDGDRSRLQFPDRVWLSHADQGFKRLEGACKFLTEPVANSSLEVLLKPQAGHQVLSQPAELANVQWIDACCGSLHGQSNPVVLASDNQPGIYWGDIHVHTRDLSDGMGTIQDAFHYMMQVSAFDFGGLGDHTFNGSHPYLVEIPRDDVHISPEDWSNLIHTCQSLSSNHFVAIPSYEWSGRINNPGLPDSWSSSVVSDKNILFGNYNLDNPVIYELVKNTDDPLVIEHKAMTPQDLYNRLDPYDYIAISHSTTSEFMGTDFDYVDDRREPVVELYSMHGANEYYGNPRPLYSVYKDGFIQQALASGKKFGFTGGGDDHYTHPGSSQVTALDYLDVAYLRYRPGMMGVLSQELSLSGLFAGIRKRCSIASTGERIVILFEVNGEQALGQIMQVDEPPFFSCTIAGTCRLEKIELIRDNEVLYCFTGTYPAEKFAFCDTDPLVGEHYYYVRVTQMDGEMAWGSPVWISQATGD